jgi:Flp pilus assembly protein protease CpaA
LFIVALIDYDWRLIPNLITFPGIPIGFAFAALAMPEVGWKKSLIGIALGGGVLFITGEIYRLVRGREGVGMGDVWLLGMTGAFLGWVGVLFTLLFGSILGTVGGLAVAQRRRRRWPIRVLSHSNKIARFCAPKFHSARFSRWRPESLRSFSPRSSVGIFPVDGGGSFHHARRR